MEPFLTQPMDVGTVLEEVNTMLKRAKTTKMDTMIGNIFNTCGWSANKVKATLVKIMANYVTDCRELGIIADPKEEMWAPLLGSR